MGYTEGQVSGVNESVFKAMSDGTRRKVLELLKNGPMTAGEIASRFPHAQPTISRHLSVLKNANLVVDERDGTFILYRLNTTVLQEWLAWVMEHFGGGYSHEEDDKEDDKADREAGHDNDDEADHENDREAGHDNDREEG